jgi:hypothetical protein
MIFMLYFQTILVRVIQAFIDAAPTLLFGILAAAFLRMVVGPEGIRRLFAGEGSRGLWRASLLACLAPVCSLGVLPIARELYRSGVSTAKVMSFTLAAPLLNPLTLCYGWTAFDPPVFALIIVISFVFSFVVGGLTARWLDDEDEDEDEDERPVPEAPPRTVGVRRMLNFGIAASRIGSGVVWKDTAWTLIVCGIAAACLPPGELSHRMHFTNPAAPPLMALVAIPAYVSPTVCVMQVSAMASVQFSLGAAVALHLLGVGLNGAVILWILKLHGVRRLISLGLVVIAMTLGLGFAADAVMDHPPGSEIDTHALDSFGQIRGTGDWPAATSQVFGREPPLANYVGLAGIAVLLMGGLILRVRGITQLADAPDAVPVEGEFTVDPAFAWDRPLPKPVVAGFAGAVMLGMLVLVVYIYYPPLPELFDEMSNVRVNAISALRSRELGIAKRELARWHSAADKLPVSARLRFALVASDADDAASELCAALKHVEENLGGSKKVVDEALVKLESAYSSVKTAFGKDREWTQ